MSILSKPSFAPSTALFYITAGALMDIWTAVYWFCFVRGEPAEAGHVALFWLAGFFLTGLTLVIIGFALGPIGRAARQAEMPPSEVTPQVAQTDMTAAQAPVVVPPAAPVAAPPVVASNASAPLPPMQPTPSVRAN